MFVDDGDDDDGNEDRLDTETRYCRRDIAARTGGDELL